MSVPAGVAAAVWFVIVAFPLYLLLATSLRDRGGYLTDGPLSFPLHLQFANYVTVFSARFGLFFLNTGIVTVACVLIVLVLALTASYAIVRSRSRMVATGFSMMLMGLAVPAQATIVPLYLIMTRLRLYDTLPAIILPTAAFALPMSILVLTSSLRDIPSELYESMAIEGASPARILGSLVLPLARPGLTTIGIYTALGAWNGFLFPLVLTQSEQSRVLTLGLWTFQTAHGVDIPGTAAAVVISMLPLLALYLVGRRFLLQGLTAGFSK